MTCRFWLLQRSGCCCSPPICCRRGRRRPRVLTLPFPDSLGPLPGTTYVYHYFWDEALLGETRVKGVSREGASRIKRLDVLRLAEGPSGGPIESPAENVLQFSAGSLNLIDSEGRVVVLLSEPLKVGQTWARPMRVWRPTSRVRQSSGTGGASFDLKHGTWTASVGTCRIEKLHRATVFGKERNPSWPCPVATRHRRDFEDEHRRVGRQVLV